MPRDAYADRLKRRAAEEKRLDEAEAILEAGGPNLVETAELRDGDLVRSITNARGQLTPFSGRYFRVTRREEGTVVSIGSAQPNGGRVGGEAVTVDWSGFRWQRVAGEGLPVDGRLA